MAGVIDALEDLQTHSNEVVYKKVLEMLENFFEQECDEDLTSLINNPVSGTVPNQTPDHMLHSSTTANEGSSTQDVEFKI